MITFFSPSSSTTTSSVTLNTGDKRICNWFHCQLFFLLLFVCFPVFALCDIYVSFFRINPLSLMEIILYVARQIKGMKRHLVLRMCTLAMNPLILTCFVLQIRKKPSLSWRRPRKRWVHKTPPQKFLQRNIALWLRWLSRLLNRKVDPWMFCVCF